jgi:hypothetical protein
VRGRIFCERKIILGKFGVVREVVREVVWEVV